MDFFAALGNAPQAATTPAITSLFADADYISIYTRAEAIEDGVLKDVSELAREAGFKYPVAIELDLYARLDPNEQDAAIGQDFTGHMWDVLTMMKGAANRTPRTDRLHFQVLIQEVEKAGAEPEMNTMNLCAVCLPGDNFEPVITIELLR
jgi:hypothetical protein